MRYPVFRTGRWDRLGEWLPAYSRAFLWVVGLSLVCMGAGMALCGPIYGSLVAGEAAHPHTPLYVRAHEALHLKVVGRMTLAGLLLFALGVASLGLYRGLCRRAERRDRL